MDKTAAAYIVYRSRKKKVVKRRFFVRPMLLERKEQCASEILWKELKCDPQKFFKFTRMTKEVYDLLITKLKAADVVHETNKYVIPFESRVSMTLRFLSQGANLKNLAWVYSCGISTAHKIVNQISKAIWEILSEEYLAPPTTEEWLKIESEFESIWNMPNCVGTIDGMHIEGKAPYKKGISFLVMAACDALYKFTLVNVVEHESSSEDRSFALSDFGRAILDGNLSLPPPKELPGSSDVTNHYFVGNETFPLKEQLMRPFSSRDITYEKLIFNDRLARSRRTIENAFGILTARWRILRKPIAALPENVNYYVLASICLHNFLMTELPDEYCPPSFSDHIDEQGRVVEGEWRTRKLQTMGGTFPWGNRPSGDAISMREKLCRYFLNEGAVPWQENERITTDDPNCEYTLVTVLE